MKIEISNETQVLMEKSNIIFKVAEISQLQEILKLYKDRSDWFKENGIDQWSKYLIRHEEEFSISIKNKDYYSQEELLDKDFPTTDEEDTQIEEQMKQLKEYYSDERTRGRDFYEELWTRTWLNIYRADVFSV